MNKAAIFEQIIRKQSFLCVGLDTEISKLPSHLLRQPDAVFSFNKEIIDATARFAVAYKPNTAFYEANGAKGWSSLEKTVAYIREKHPEVFIIADAKRGDIGSTSANYAKAFFESMNVDAVTVAPYMGYDAVSPFLEFSNKWVVLLALTSNISAANFQYLELESGMQLYEKVIYEAKNWASSEQMMFVVGATHPDAIEKIREIIPDYFLLVPGVGAQGGSLEVVAEKGLNGEAGLLVNSSRQIIYASSGIDFAQKAAAEAQRIQLKMKFLLEQKGLL